MSRDSHCRRIGHAIATPRRRHVYGSRHIDVTRRHYTRRLAYMVTGRKKAGGIGHSCRFQDMVVKIVG